MSISEGLFTFLLFLAIVPSYVFALYGLYISRMTSSMVGKILEQDISNAIGAGNGGAGGQPVYSTSLSMQDFAKLMKEGKHPKKGDEEGDGVSTPLKAGPGHYL